MPAPTAVRAVLDALAWEATRCAAASAVSMARYGLDYASLKQINSRLVYCSVTGFGQTGPYRERAGYDYAVQGMGGLMSVTGERDDIGGGPQKVGVAVADLFTGMYATVAILAALRHCERTGKAESWHGGGSPQA